MRGGSRPGAGRKPGSATKKVREIANAVAEGAPIPGFAEAKTPLEVLLAGMRFAQMQSDLPNAIECAKLAAPYVHPRLAQVQAEVRGDVATYVVGGVAMTTEEWAAKYGADQATP